MDNFTDLMVAWLEGEGKWITGAWAGISILGFVSYFVLSPLTGAVVIGLGMMSLLYSTHVYWTYQSMREDPEFDHNPLWGALAGVTMMFVVAVVAAFVLLYALAWASAALGVPMVLLGVGVLVVGFLAYAFVLA